MAARDFLELRSTAGRGMASTKLNCDVDFGVMVDFLISEQWTVDSEQLTVDSDQPRPALATSSIVGRRRVIICKMLAAERMFSVGRSGMGCPAMIELKVPARGFVVSRVRKSGPGAPTFSWPGLRHPPR